ncbi:MAG: PEGA domain-containing protein [Candidatus Zixiibacteriota bacterium]
MLKRILTALAIGCLLSIAAHGQEVPPGGLTVRSSPPGADVLLEGEAVAAGITPTTFQQTFIGDYKVTIKKYLYEKYSTHVTLDPAKQLALDVNLSPKTRIKAAARSVFIPGWGQRYSEQKGKSLLFMFLAAGSVAAYAIADHEFDKDFDLYETRKAEYDSARTHGASYQELQQRYVAWSDAQKEAYDSEDIRRITIGTVIGVWGLNVLDALLFFPNNRGSITVQGIDIHPDTKNQTFGLVVSKRW